MNEQPSVNYDFSPAAMLPAWFVTDANFYIVNWNCIFAELLREFQLDHKLGSRHFHALGLGIQSDPECENIWEQILTLQSFQQINKGLEILIKIIGIAADCNEHDKHLLFDRIRKIDTTIQGIGTYALIPDDEFCLQADSPSFLAGVKIAPPAGLELKKKANVAQSEIEFVDVVIACRFDSQTLTVQGIQPAIHDCTEKHYFWAQFTNQLSRLMVHSFKNPLATADSLIKGLNRYVVPDGQATLNELRASVDQANRLSKLTNFANHGKQGRIRYCASISDASLNEEILLQEIKEQFALTSWNVFCGAEEIYDRERAENLLAEFQIQSDKITLQSFRALADKVVHGLVSFRITVEGKNTQNILKKSKGRIVEFIVDEMVLNAIKAADHDHPLVNVLVEIDDLEDLLTIQVRNNGTPLPTDWFINFEEELLKLSQEPGNKRKPLGLRLNLEAAKLLGISFEPKYTETGSLFVLSIPKVKCGSGSD